MKIYPYDMNSPETHPKKDGRYLILFRDGDIDVDDEFWMESKWSSMGGCFDRELYPFSGNIDPCVRVFGYMPLPDTVSVIEVLDKGEVYIDRIKSAKNRKRKAEKTEEPFWMLSLILAAAFAFIIGFTLGCGEHYCDKCGKDVFKQGTSFKASNGDVFCEKCSAGLTKD